MNQTDRLRFDALLDDILVRLPRAIHELLEEAPLIVDDVPSAEILAELGLDPDDDDLCGLHSGTMITERSIESVDLPETIHLFRAGIVDQSGGWDAGDDAVREEIRITLLHEIGHHFGLEEEDLEALGYE